jgi:putative membrane protein
VTTLVLCVDRGGDFDCETPVVGREAVGDLVTAVGVEDPEDSRVNCLLETLRIARDIQAKGDNDDAIVAIVSGTGESVNVDRDIAHQVDALVAEHDPQSAVVIVDSAEDELAVPIIESRLRVDAVDRVIVRQARDLESTYYLLKQFLSDEELRGTVLVPLGTILLAVPIIVSLTRSITAAIAVVTAVIGAFFLYKGLSIDDRLAGLSGTVQEAFYSGRVSLVTYAVGTGLALVGLFVGAITVSEMNIGLRMVVRFIFTSIPWLALAAFVASTGRLFDELLNNDHISSAFLNVPFAVIAVGLVIRGFAAFFLENAGIIEPLLIPSTTIGPLSTPGVRLFNSTRLIVFVVAGILISLFGIGFSSHMGDMNADEEITEESS